jgi:hypothetical protein
MLVQCSDILWVYNHIYSPKLQTVERICWQKPTLFVVVSHVTASPILQAVVDSPPERTKARREGIKVDILAVHISPLYQTLVNQEPAKCTTDLTMHQNCRYLSKMKNKHVFFIVGV